MGGLTKHHQLTALQVAKWIHLTKLKRVTAEALEILGIVPASTGDNWVAQLLQEGFLRKPTAEELAKLTLRSPFIVVHRPEVSVDNDDDQEEEEEGEGDAEEVVAPAVSTVDDLSLAEQ